MRSSLDGKVVYVGATSDFTGYGTAAREHAVALRSVGYDFKVYERNYTDCGAQDPRLEPITHQGSRTGRPLVGIYHLLPPYIHDTLSFLDATYRIGYVAWETDKLPKRFKEVLNQMDEFWCPCDQNVEVMKREFPNKPAYKIPHPVVYDIPENIKESTLDIAGIDDDTFLFLSLCHSQGRKNILAMMKAFNEAFTKDDNAALLLKTGSGPVVRLLNSDIQRLKSASKLPDQPLVLQVSKFIPEVHIQLLMMRANAYVSLSHAEGFGFGPARAMYLGKPTIVSGVPGHLEYCTTHNSFVVPAHQTPVYDEYMHFDARMKWHDVNILDAAEKMRACYDNPEIAAQRAKSAQKKMREQYSYDVIGNLMKDRLEEICASNPEPKDRPRMPIAEEL